jgi:hypothetical protein
MIFGEQVLSHHCLGERLVKRRSAISRAGLAGILVLGPNLQK